MGAPGRVVNASAVSWASRTDDIYDVAIGNPPFVRYHDISHADHAAATQLGERMGITFAGVSNLWLLIVLGALSRLRHGGAFAFVAPTESLGGVSAAVLRRWLLNATTQIGIDVFAPQSFPGVLQEVLVISGRRDTLSDNMSTHCAVIDHTNGAAPTQHVLSPTAATWTRYLLTAPQISAFEDAQSLPVVEPLSQHAVFTVAAVTGANSFFTATDRTLSESRLCAWSRPLLSRIRHAPGLIYTDADHTAAASAGLPTHLLDFSAESPDPLSDDAAARYLAHGVEAGVADRYKCRIRRPWFRVPHIAPGTLMLPKRSHHYHRLVVNRFGAVTVDNIYRGYCAPLSPCTAADLAAGFHNSLSLLSAELVGRSYGGGVLELVPSEVARLQIPALPGIGRELARLDATARQQASPQRLIDETDKLLAASRCGLEWDTLRTLAEARSALAGRRLERGRGH